MAKLTEDQVFEIRRLTSLGHRQSDVGAMFSVSQATVSLISRGLTWRSS